MPMLSRPRPRPVSLPVAAGRAALPALAAPPVRDGVVPTNPAGPTIRSNGVAASMRLNRVPDDCGEPDVAVNAVALYRAVPYAGLPTSDSGIFKEITPVPAL